MSIVETTKMSSKGQVVIPEDIRKKLGLKAGSQLIVVAEKDVVILKSISAPPLAEFDSLISKVRKQVKEGGLKKSDIPEIIAQVRDTK